jgi:hypothetical protein
MIVPKWRVFKPVDEVSVLQGHLRAAVSVSGDEELRRKLTFRASGRRPRSQGAQILERL